MLNSLKKFLKKNLIRAGSNIIDDSSTASVWETQIKPDVEGKISIQDNEH